MFFCNFREKKYLVVVCYHSGVGFTSWHSGTSPFYFVGIEKIGQANPATDRRLNNKLLSFTWVKIQRLRLGKAQLEEQKQKQKY